MKPTPRTRSQAGSDIDANPRRPTEGNHTAGCSAAMSGPAPLTTDAHNNIDPLSPNKTFIVLIFVTLPMARRLAYVRKTGC